MAEKRAEKTRWGRAPPKSAQRTHRRLAEKIGQEARKNEAEKNEQKNEEGQGAAQERAENAQKYVV